jgi:hypothetical protein
MAGLEQVPNPSAFSSNYREMPFKITNLPDSTPTISVTRPGMSRCGSESPS